VRKPVWEQEIVRLLWVSWQISASRKRRWLGSATWEIGRERALKELPSDKGGRVKFEKR